MRLVLALALVGCSTPPPAEPPAAEAPSCAVTLETLPGSTWVYLAPQPMGDPKPSPIARMRFDGSAGALTAKYTAASAGDVYDYTCTVEGKVGTCVESDLHADAFCKAWAATHDGVCDPAAVAAATGLPQAELDKVAGDVNKMLKKLKGAEKERQRQVDNSPNNKIRSKFILSVDPSSCQLAVQDKYVTMVDGKVAEFENQIGAGRFAQTQESFVFQSCKDVDGAWAVDPADPKGRLGEVAPGPVTFAAVLPKGTKAAEGCTYEADLYVDWKKQATLPGAAGDKGAVRWETAVPFNEPGIHAVFFDRSKTCGGAKETLGVTCAIVKVTK